MHKTINSLISIGLIGTTATLSHAGLVFTSTTLTENSISFEISGSIDGPAPTGDDLNFLFFVDPLRPNGWISAFEVATITSNISVNGNPNEVDNLWIEPGFGGESNDRITMNQNENGGFNSGDTLSGTFTASWVSPIDLSGFGSELEVYWGRDTNYNEFNGTYQGTFSTVPAPGAMALLGLGGLLGARRRR